MKNKFLVIIILLVVTFNNVNAEEVTVELKKCVDGDTARFIINNEEKTTRFLAIDTPEVKHGKNEAEPYGEKASEYTCKKLKNAKKIVLEYDDNSDKVDKYGRVLAWVFVDGKLLQNELVKNGYAEVKYLYGDYKYTSTLEKSLESAKKKKINMWSGEEEKKKKK